MAKYQIGDILSQSDGEITLHYLIEDYSASPYGKIYFFRILETNRLFDQVADIINNSKQIKKVA